jgi:hypothetical protein
VTTVTDCPAVTNRAAAVLALLALAVIAILLSAETVQLAFLQKAAGYTPAGGTSFSGAKNYLDNLHGGIAPLAIPACLIGLSIGGLGLASGQQWAQRTLTGVLIGATIIFLGPQILA